MRLADRIADHRHLYHQDLLIPKLVTRQPPTTLDLNTGELHVEDGAAIGMTMSGRLLKYLSHPEGYGTSFPWSRALYAMRGWCRREHRRRYHAAERQWNGSLCHQLVRYVVIHNWSVENAGRILTYDNPEPVLREALTWIEHKIDDARRLAEKREREYAGLGPGPLPVDAWAHHAPSAEHVAECPNPECVRRRAA